MDFSAVGTCVNGRGSVDHSDAADQVREDVSVKGVKSRTCSYVCGGWSPRFR